jgi:hypothetical protein
VGYELIELYDKIGEEAKEVAEDCDFENRGLHEHDHDTGYYEALVWVSKQIQEQLDMTHQEIESVDVTNKDEVKTE